MKTYWEGVFARLNLFVGHFDLVGFKGRAAKEEGEADDSHGPNVDFVGVAYRPLNDFRGDVVRSAAHSALLFVTEL